MPKLSIRDLDLKAKRVFIRVDFNVPIKDGAIGDDTRIRASLPTIRYALEHGAAVVVLASHLGRPKGKPNPQFSLKPVVDRLSALAGVPVVFAGDCIGDAASRAVAEAQRPGGGRLVLLENLRFHPEEEKNDPVFAKALASLADVYVDDAFGAAHRAHASVEGITKFLKPAAAGLLMEQELRYLGHALEAPERPFVAILGGAKVSDKIEVIENMLGKVNRLIIGGAMAYTFFKSRGLPVGKSLVEDDKLDAAKKIELDAKTRGVQLELPVDHVVTTKIEAGAPHEVLRVDDPAIGDRMGVDIGPATIARYQAAIGDAKTVVWNGPMGVFEIDAFAAGTNAVARAVASVKGTTIIGGGDSIAAVKKAGIADRITHISTGGGASLEFLGGRVLPGVAALTDK
jgi:phosphoglycerate kinase